MTTATERAMSAYIEALVARGDFEAYFADDVLWTTMETSDEVRGRDAVRDLIVWMHERAFDGRPELRHLVCGDGVAALEAVFVARHIEEFAGIPATGATVRLPYTMFYELSGDRITVIRAYLSMVGLVAQIEASAQPAGRS